MNNITQKTETLRAQYGGATIYICPWNDYRNKSFAKVWAHAIAHAYCKGYFALPIRMIKQAFHL
jgi:hypothetical protein